MFDQSIFVETGLKVSQLQPWYRASRGINELMTLLMSIAKIDAPDRRFGPEATYGTWAGLRACAAGLVVYCFTLPVMCMKVTV